MMKETLIWLLNVDKLSVMGRRLGNGDLMWPLELVRWLDHLSVMGESQMFFSTTWDHQKGHWLFFVSSSPCYIMKSTWFLMFLSQLGNPELPHGRFAATRPHGTGPLLGWKMLRRAAACHGCFDGKSTAFPGCTLGWSNMAMENTLFIADFPIETPILSGFSIATFDCRRVYIYIYTYISIISLYWLINYIYIYIYVYINKQIT